MSRRVWVCCGLGMASGALAALAHPPFGFLPGLLGYGLLMQRVDRIVGERPLRSAFLVGWLSGLAYFAISTWWVAHAFLVDAQRQGWMAPFAVILLASGLALFWGAAAALYRKFNAGGAHRVLVFAGCVALLEWLRGHLLTGFPWNLPGETFRAGSPLSQGAALAGVYGMTWFVVLVSAALSLAREGRRGAIAAGAAMAFLAALWSFGTLRLRAAQTPVDGAPVVRIIQTNVAQSAKYDPAGFYDIVGRYTKLTPSPGQPADLVVWPEGAIPAAFEDYLAPGTWTRAAISQTVAPEQTLVVGGYRQANGKYYNSLLALRGPQLAVQGRYDKYRLVPFGEYLPLEPLWRGVKQMVGVGDGFSPGPQPGPITIGKGLPMVQPLICYESLFPGFTRQARRRSGAKVNLIINISNDAWFGAGAGPRQHLNLASYRAIEEGLPMVRATPTGISAVIDAYGRIPPGASLPMGRMGAIETVIPPSLPSTLYSRWGEGLFLLLQLASAAMAWRLDGRRRLAETALTKNLGV